MAADKKTRKSARTGSAASLRASSEARWLAAERDTHHMLAMLDAWEESGGMGERAWQYAQMARVYFKKLRNGRVLSSADFDITVHGDVKIGTRQHAPVAQLLEIHPRHLRVLPGALTHAATFLPRIQHGQHVVGIALGGQPACFAAGPQAGSAAGPGGFSGFFVCCHVSFLPPEPVCRWFRSPDH